MLKIIKFLDRYIGSIVCRILGIFNFFSKTDAKKINPKKILVIQLWGIGESVLTLPAVKSLIQKFPKAGVDVLVTKRNKEVYNGIKGLNSIKKIDFSIMSIIEFVLSNFRKYDVVVDMEEYLNVSAIISFFAGKCRVGYSHGARSKIYNLKVYYDENIHVRDVFLELANSIGAEYKKEGLIQLNYNKKDRKNVDGLLKKYRISPKIIGISPGTAESAKCRMWPYEKYAEACNSVIEKYNATVMFVGTEEERRLADEIIKNIEKKENAVNLCGKFSLRELFYFVTKCDVFIGNDSGAMHIAAAQKVKTIGLFGPNLPQRFSPYGKGNAAIYKGENCIFSPCINVHKGQVPDCLYSKSGHDYQKCMKNISVNEVVAEVEKMIEY